ncbi:hypothetical protein JCM16303_005845 [Sporobolomyces ruberrimus]
MSSRSASLTLRRSLTSKQSSTFASTSAFTLDHNHSSYHTPATTSTLPTFDHFLPEEDRPTRGRKSRRTSRNPKLRFPDQLSSPSPLRPASVTRRPRSDPTQVSPYLPQITREKNHLLSQFRSTLHNSLPPSSSTLLSRRRKLPTSHSNSTTASSSSRIDQTWVDFVKVLRYPHEEIPNLARSHFPTSTRSPEPFPSSSSSSPSTYSNSTLDSSIRTNTFDPSFPPPSPATPVQSSQGRHYFEDSTTRIGIRDKIELSLRELHETFKVFASQRPRTRTGLHRLLVVVELIARNSKQLASPPRGGGDGQGQGGGGGGGEVEEGRLKGGGVGLTEKEWRQLIMFVGTNLRSTRPDPDTKSVLSLFAQKGELTEGGSTRGRRKKKKKEEVGVQSRVRGKEETRMYNSLLHVAVRSRMWELFDQILERMQERGVQEDCATFVARISREDERGSEIGFVWRWFEKGLRWTSEGERNGLGKRSRKEGRKVLWNLIVWVLAKRGMFEEVEKIYGAMKEGKTVRLDELEPKSTARSSSLNYSYEPTDPFGFIRPTNDSDSRSDPPLQVRLPSPDHRLYSSLIQAYSHHGQLKSALLTTYEMVNLGNYPAQPQHFHSLFRGFVRYGSTNDQRPNLGGGGGVLEDWVSLSGIRSDKNHYQSRTTTTSSSSSPASPLSILSQASSRRTSSTTMEESTDYTLSTLLTIYESFLSLSPPPPHVLPSSTTTSSKSPQAVRSLPFEGQRTAPSSQTIYFVLKAFENLLGGRTVLVLEPEIMIRVYERLEDKFTNRDKEKKDTMRREWRGWRMDKRVGKFVQGYRAVKEEKERRLGELM